MAPLVFAALSTVARGARAEATDGSHAAEIASAASLAASVGEYGFAVHAFDEAFALSGRSELLFDLGEAHRQRYALEHAREDLQAAVDAYRRYIALGGAHVEGAQRTLEKLEPQLEGGSVPPPAGEERIARIAVISPVARATVRVDGGSPHSLPAFLEVAPGTHTLAIGASGFQDALAVVRSRAREIDVENVPLTPAPARLAVEKPNESDVYVDGVSVGPAPLPRPVDVDPGSHFVTVSMNGHGAFSKEISFERGKTKTLAPTLPETPQRKAAWALIGTGGVSLAVGIGLGVVAVVKDRQASNIAPRMGEMLSPTDQTRYDALTSSRDNFRTAAGAAGGIGLGLIVVGGVLYAFNSPPDPATPKPKEKKIGAPVVLPMVGPGFVGAVAGATFD